MCVRCCVYCQCAIDISMYSMCFAFAHAHIHTHFIQSVTHSPIHQQSTAFKVAIATAVHSINVNIHIYRTEEKNKTAAATAAAAAAAVAPFEIYTVHIQRERASERCYNYFYYFIGFLFRYCNVVFVCHTFSSSSLPFACVVFHQWRPLLHAVPSSLPNTRQKRSITLYKYY